MAVFLCVKNNQEKLFLDHAKNAPLVTLSEGVKFPFKYDQKRGVYHGRKKMLLGVSRPTVYNLLKRNEFRWIQLDGRKYRISKKSFDEWLDKQPE